jgi:iron(III) transport system permease protein
MRAWRLSVLLILALTLSPLLWAVGHAFNPAAWPSAATWARVAVLLGNTAALIAGTLALALPAGVALAVLLERTDLPGRLPLFGVLIAPLALPLPLWMSGWLLYAGTATPIELAERIVPWMPGMGPAVLFHALAGLPWVALIVSWGLRWGGDLEEAGLTVRGPWWVMWHVTLWRARPALAAAALWLAVQAAGEITITDLFQVRTFAEEVYTQFVLPEPDGHGDPQARAALTALPWVAVAILLGILLMGELGVAERLSSRPAPRFRLGRWRWPAFALIGALVIALAAIPLAGLAWRAGGLRVFRDVWLADGPMLLGSLSEAVSAGLVASYLALLCAWLGRGRMWFRVAVLIVAAAAWAMPGPVLGLALKGQINAMLDAVGRPSWLATLLYYGPSYLPVGWVAVIRTFPFALAVVWPAVRRVPGELLESARVDGVGPGGELASVVYPLVWPAWLAAWGAAALLSLGELSAGKMVSTPGGATFAELVWGQLHYGVTADLAARCLLLAAVALAGGAALAWARLRAPSA